MKPEEVGTKAAEILRTIEQAVVGKHRLLEWVMAGVLSGGHLLFEDAPGLGKTLIARSFAQALGLEFKRIQFTPDLLPGDVTGSDVFDRKEDRFRFVPGPIFTHVLLADEINRATPKTQSALLEAMQEFQVSIGGMTRPLAEPFVVFATQNPIEFEGTFPLPEAQIDRFIMRVGVGYPELPDEVEIVRRREQRHTDEVTLPVVSSRADILEMRGAVETVHIDPDLETYIVSLVRRTRSESSVRLGASPRGALALLKLSRALAAVRARDYVLPDDIKEIAVAALAHRLLLEPELWAKAISAEDVVRSVLDAVPVPKVER